jgi:dipeptidyl aminopeptidase/acylaminoacyl peptidase
MNRWFCFVVSLIAVADGARAEPLTLEQIMQHPDWIGPPVEAPFLSIDGESAYFELKRAGSDLRDLYRVPTAGGALEKLDAAAQAQIDGRELTLNEAATLALFTRHGDVFLRELESGALTQVTRSAASESEPRFLRDGRIAFRSDRQWWMADARGAVAAPAAPLEFSDDPLKPDDERLVKDELALIATLKRDRDGAQAERRQALDDAAADANRAAEPIYLGKGQQLIDSELSPDGSKLLIVTQAEGPNSPGTGDKMPHFVTPSAYVEVEDVRTLVGLDDPAPQTLTLIDLKSHATTEIKLDALPGVFDDPLAELRAQADGTKPKRKLAQPRPVTVMDAQWSGDGAQLAVQLRAIDNKDRWLATVDFDTGALKTQHRLTDAAWINWNFNDFGWLDDHQTLWLLSEETNHSQLYLKPLGGKLKALTRGGFEIREPIRSRMSDYLYFAANRINPTRYEIYRVPTAGGEIEPLTDLGGVNAYTLSQDETRLLISHSKSHLPPQLIAQPIGGAPITLTDTRSAAFKAVDWMQPEFVHIESSHFDGDFLNKLYVPKSPNDGLRPAVIFVHGAGYTQDVHQGWPYYFREQMFHQLLTEKGVVVLVPDYRASEGYGRDFRTAIYRQMGTPETEDLRDSIEYLVREQRVDRSRIGVYGGSYGGFMTLMALFKAPELFASGAALRPVTDWAHYNHEYTANILNTPDLDPAAYAISSPIRFAEGLQKPLLIAHGMLDDNVFYKDTVRLQQRLIELGKTDWEVAGYPLERHGYVHPEAWLDQYRRVYRLFEHTLKF